MGQQLRDIARNDFDEIHQIIHDMGKDAATFYGKGNKASGGRLRKSYLEIAKICTSARANIQTIKSLNPPVPKKEPNSFL
jgi:hypothetical protein